MPDAEDATEMPRSTTPVSPAGVAVVVALAFFSTALAVVLREVSHAPGDRPFTLLVAGCAVAFLVGTTRIAPSVLVGLAAQAGFPVAAMLDLARNGGHSLLPFEFLFYAVYVMLGAAAAGCGSLIGGLLRPAGQSPAQHPDQPHQGGDASPRR